MQQQKQSCKTIIRDNRGVALIYALVVMAVITALALALLYGVGVISLQTASYDDQDDCYVQALSLSNVLGQQLTGTKEQGKGDIYDAAIAYMPDSASDEKEEELRFSPDTLPDGYGSTLICFQNGVEEVFEPKDWESKQLGQQYLDVTVKVFGKRGGKESVTTRYRFYRELDDDDMEYTLETKCYTGEETIYKCVYDENSDSFTVTDATTGDTVDTLTINGTRVTMEMAEKWAGNEQDDGLRLMRHRRILGYGEGAESEYKGKELRFEKMYTTRAE